MAEPTFYFVDCIPSELVDLIVKEVDKLSTESYESGEVLFDVDKSEYALQPKSRDSKVSWWGEEHWVSSLFSHYFNKANRENWEYDLSNVETIQITKYDVGQFYDWHCDYFSSKDPRYTRKLSASLLITDPSEFEGGNLEFITYHGQKVSYEMGKGTIIIFDSRVPHRVLPVTSGRRISLVSWMLGPKLR
jgi:Rps23 Pro-64 3,4-dihydroxylase Tpa1-like proline 4-hydroxylase